MRVERYNYAYQLGRDFPLLLSRIEEILTTGRYILTKEVENFEAAFAAYLGARTVLGTNTGTDALYLALKALGLEPGDEVITQANTFYATVAAICLAGARPVLLDADERSFLMDTTALEASITPRTRAIVPVHLYGKPTPMATIQTIAQRHELKVVEDAAQAHGAKLDGGQAGTFGSLACFSFHPSKNLAAAGDGGAVAVNEPKYVEDIRRRRALGQVSQNEHVLVGINSKLDALQAAVLLHKLPHLDAWNRKRTEIAERYRQRLEALPLTFQQTDHGEVHVYHLFQVRTIHRDALLQHLRKQGVDAVVRYPQPIHLQAAFAQQGWRRGQYPVAENLARELLALPIRPDLTEAEVDWVCRSVQDFFSRNAS